MREGGEALDASHGGGGPYSWPNDKGFETFEPWEQPRGAKLGRATLGMSVAIADAFDGRAWLFVAGYLSSGSGGRPSSSPRCADVRSARTSSTGLRAGDGGAVGLGRRRRRRRAPRALG